MKKIFYFSLFVLLLTVASCSKESDSIPTPNPTPNPTTEDYVLSEKVVELKGEQIKQINTVKGDTLVYDKTVSGSSLPKVGDIILISKENAGFPYGFLGKVSQVTDAEKIYVITEEVALDEAFDYLNVTGTCDLVPADNSNQTRASVDGLSKHTFELNLGDFLQGSMEVKNRISISYDFQIDKQKNEKICNAYIETDFANDITIDGKIKSKDLEKENIYKIGKGIAFGAITLGPIVLVPTFQPQITTHLEGNINMAFELNTTSGSNTRLEYKNGSWGVAKHSDNGRTWSFNPLPQFTLEGKTYFGVGAAIEFRLAGNADNKIGLNGLALVEASGEVSVDLNNNNDDETMLYTQLKDEKINLVVKATLKAEAGAKFFKIVEAKWEHPLVEKTFLESDHYLFPAFEKDSIKFNENQIYAYSELKRNLLWKQNAGLALYDGNNLIQKSEPIEYKFEEKSKEEKIYIEGLFKNIPKEEKSNYSVWTYVKWEDVFIKCKRINDNKLVGKWEDEDGCCFYVFNANGSGYYGEYENNGEITGEHIRWEGSAPTYTLIFSELTQTATLIDDSKIIVSFYDGDFSSRTFYKVD